LPISTVSPGNKDWISLLKKTHLEMNSFILKDAGGHTKGYFKSAELTGTYAVLVSTRGDWELTKPPRLSSVAWASSKGIEYRRIIQIAPTVSSCYTNKRHEDRLLLVVVGAGDGGPRKLNRASPCLFACSLLEARETSTCPSRKSPKKA